MIAGTHFTRILVVAGLAALGAAPLYGQNGSNADSRTRDKAHALILFTQAEGMIDSSNLDCWGDAAVLYEKAARLFGSEEPQAFRAMFRAAQLHYYGKDYDVALSLMEEAGQIAANLGLYFRAAETYLLAAGLAFELKRKVAPELVAQAVELARSPRLTADERLMFERRLHVTRVASR